MSCMWSMKVCVPGGMFVHLISGDVPSPAGTPGAACEYFTGISPPSGNPATVIVIGGAAGAPPPRCACAEQTDPMTNVATNRKSNFFILVLRGEGEFITRTGFSPCLWAESQSFS